MAVHETQVDAVSRVYAQSLFELADARGGQAAIEEINDELESIVELARSDRAFGEFMSSRIIGVVERARRFGRSSPAASPTSRSTSC